MEDCGTDLQSKLSDNVGFRHCPATMSLSNPGRGSNLRKNGEPLVGLPRVRRTA
jgi:hypothetical protein